MFLFPQVAGAFVPASSEAGQISEYTSAQSGRAYAPAFELHTDGDIDNVPFVPSSDHCNYGTGLGVCVAIVPVVLAAQLSDGQCSLVVPSLRSAIGALPSPIPPPPK